MELELAEESNNNAPAQEESKPRDYTNASQQNLITILRVLESKSPLPATQKQLAQETGLSKYAIFSTCWNMVKGGLAEEIGDGSIRLKKGTEEKASWVGRMVIRAVRDAYGVNLAGE